MRGFLFLFAMLPLMATERIGLDEFRERRAKLRKAHPDAVFLLFGNTQKEHGDLRSGFFQEPNFYYLTGWTEPGAVLVLTPATDLLLIPRRDPEEEKWTGPKAGPDSPGIAKLTGFEKVGPAETFESGLAKWIESGKKIYMLGSDERTAKVKALLPLRTISDAMLPIARLRMIKSPGEIAAIQRATEVTMDAHAAAWTRIQAGLFEYQIAAVMSNAYFDKGCERHAYTPIVGSGPNAAVLHYSKNSRRMDDGELLLMDVGAECSMYASDITRTVPVGGKFTPRQREIYRIVLEAQKAAIAAVKPGATLSKNASAGLYRIARDYIDSQGKDRHGNGLGKYFTHGLGHHVGLDVHDANDPDIPLAAGMVITIEPGIYIPEESIGVRIEDMVLVTENGAKVLSSRLPKEIEEVERAISR